MLINIWAMVPRDSRESIANAIASINRLLIMDWYLWWSIYGGYGCVELIERGGDGVFFFLPFDIDIDEPW